ncbi:hypothetical protein LOD99_6577 [Oopsacas minuta]|uniref:Uncharacterized protein n=1 Tax=Oopsacas minuta TaxID=111878 RepID=A0AAV7JLW6_9METZ|nr:hypothetical protein LOD99_6577 [Oopsacas minuta]
MSVINKNSIFLKPQRKVRPLPKKSTKFPIVKESERATTGNKNSRLLTDIGNTLPKPNPIQQTDKPTMITRNRITTQAGIFNMAKVSKTVSRGPLTAQQDNSMMDQEDSSMITRVINQNSQQSLDQSFQNQEHTMMDISKLTTPESDNQKSALRHKPTESNCHSTKQDKDSQQTSNNDIPFKEIEHNLLHSISPQDYLKRSNTLALIKRDLHATIKRNIPHEIYSQFFKNTEPVPQPIAPSLPEKRNMPLQPRNLANLPNNQDRKLSEWTLLMGSFSSQEDEDISLAGKIDSKSNAISMMDTDMPLSNLSQQSVGEFDTTSKPDYLDSPTPVTMYPQKMF